MSSTTTTTTTNTTANADTYKLKLQTAYGPRYQEVSKVPARECTSEEIPVIDISGMNGDLEARKKVAAEVRRASESSGFFYVKNHGIDEKILQTCREQAIKFFKQPAELKDLTNKNFKKLNNGWSAPKTIHISPDESPDLKERFGWSYSPLHDPLHEGREFTEEELQLRTFDEPRVWEGTAHLPGYKDAALAYWRACLNLSRQLLHVFALSLDLPEDYFDSITTFPGADCCYNFYPALTPEQLALPYREVGIGSHTDVQCFTLLWQDMSGGLQILNPENKWIWAKPIEGTIVVNIGDFFSRLTNDRYKSAVHRAYNRGLDNEDRISMPFFFGFNRDEDCAVLPSCVDDEHPAKYEPISCGEWVRRRFMHAMRDMKIPLPIPPEQQQHEQKQQQ